ncbi:MAG: thymidine kinase [Spirochaetia bacterium]|nr:thymidine kinase [Spirochaetia bacterium]MCE1208688.1 thymidine kinase [Spirochaetia bacterium]
MDTGDNGELLRNLGFPLLNLHSSYAHYDFVTPGRRVLVIGPMGSGKTEFSARIWRDSTVALRKKGLAAALTTSGAVDRRKVFVVRASLDKARFPDYPDDALAYRGGFERCGDRIGSIKDSFQLETLMADNPEVGTWIIDEAAFFDERIAYLMADESRRRGVCFVCPSLVLNFRREIFNQTARLLLENATDIFPLTAYCEHEDCLKDSLYTYRYYSVDGKECPALYFDPLIIIGGDRAKSDGREPNYCTRCDEHHYLPGKEYSFFTLKPLGEMAARGNIAPLLAELNAIAGNIRESRLYASLHSRYVECEEPCHVQMNALLVPCIAERALVYLYAEQNLLSAEQLRYLIRELALDKDYLSRRLSDNRRPVEF